MHVALGRLHLQQFLSHNSFAGCFTRNKNRQHFHQHTAYYYSIERARVVGMLQQYVSITLSVCIDHRSLNAGVRNAWRPENDEFSSVYRKMRHFVSRRPGFVNILGKNVLLIIYQHLAISIPLALSPFYVVILRMMMQMVVCFSFKWNIQQMICEIKIAANANSPAPRAFCVFEHFPLCTWRFTEYLNNYHGNRRL